jgi:hypothetical protein
VVDAEDLGEDEMVIHSGLQEGDQVVVSAQFLLDSEANLQAGLSRLTGGQTSGHTEHGVAAPPAAMHKGAMSQGAMHEGAMPQGAMHEGAMPPGAMHEGAMPQGATNEGAMPQGATDEAPTPQGAMHEGTVQ